MTKRTASDDFKDLDLLSPKVAQRRTDDLLRNLLNAPPDPQIAPAKPANAAPKKPSKKK